MRTKLSAARVLAPALALGAVGLLFAPAKGSFGFTTIGGSLAASSQRDWRIFDNFADGQANNNVTPDANFPGWLGAEVALWKAASEWASRSHGTGAGDPTQTNIGDGGANFDFFFAGAATSAGTSNQNVASVLPSCGGGGTLAYVLTPISDGWTLKYCDEWTWADGPSTINGSQFDIQDIGTHELGHSLGLGHSSNGGATMFGAAGSGQISGRSLHSDDIAGVQFVYGLAAGNKARINSVNVDLVANNVTITGANFGATGNEVWFTRELASSPGSTAEVRVTGVNSTGGGTQIVVSIPSTAGGGDVAVKVPGTGHESLSNSWPLDLVGGGSSDPLTMGGITPASVPALIPGTAKTVTITGTGFDSSIVLSVDLVPVPAASYTIVNSMAITLDMPQTSALGSRTVSIQKGAELAFSFINVVAPSGPVVQAGNGDPANPVSGTLPLTVAGPVGELEYVMYSFSNLPSVFLPYAQLEIGNAFSDLNLIDSYTIPSAGWLTQNLPINPGPALIYIQALTLGQGLPAVDSNVSSFQITP